jgi:hypothetical protein
MQEKLRIIGKEEGIKGLGRKGTKSAMDRNGKLEKVCWKHFVSFVTLFRLHAAYYSKSATSVSACGACLPLNL